MLPNSNHAVLRIADAERERLIVQLGTNNPATAQAAALKVVGMCAGVDVNMGCPKPFALAGGMGAANIRDQIQISMLNFAPLSRPGERQHPTLHKKNNKKTVSASGPFHCHSPTTRAVIVEAKVSFHPNLLLLRPCWTDQRPQLSLSEHCGRTSRPRSRCPARFGC